MALVQVVSETGEVLRSGGCWCVILLAEGGTEPSLESEASACCFWKLLSCSCSVRPFRKGPSRLRLRYVSGD